MRVELNFYKDSGKWYTTEYINLNDLSQLDGANFIYGMDYTVHIIEEDGFKQPYRLCKKQ